MNGGIKSLLYIVDRVYMTAADANAINLDAIEEVKVLKDVSKLAFLNLMELMVLWS